MDPYTWIYMLVYMLVSVAISLLTAQSPKRPEVQTMDVPTSEEGLVIPVCFGTNLIKSSNVTWYGDPSTKDIKTKGGKK